MLPSSVLNMPYFLVVFLLVTGLAAGAEPSVPTETFGPRLDDATFFSLLDLSRNDLLDVRRAVEQRDWSVAKHTFAEHIRHRALPRLEFRQALLGENRP